MSLPTSLETALDQALQAMTAARSVGYRRLQVDILDPDLKIKDLVYPLLAPLATGEKLQVFLPDAGAAALAQHRWQPLPEGVQLCALGSRLGVDPEALVLFACPNVVSIEEVETLCNQAGREQTILLVNPQFQDAATVGIGLAGRRLRQRFLVTFEPVYFLQSLNQGALFRCYPEPWQLWQLIGEGDYALQASFDRRPSGEELLAAQTPQQPSLWQQLLQGLGDVITGMRKL
ncbi:MAG: DUF1995 family protein [Thermostichales cyanobacterium BF4_bins_65]